VNREKLNVTCSEQKEDKERRMENEQKMQKRNSKPKKL